MNEVAKTHGLKKFFSSDLNNLFPFFLFAGIALNAMGLFNEILEPDGTLYATIAKHIGQTNDWINLIAKGGDWLDKPHLPFWITAISFKIFGCTAFAYKFPAFVFWLIGIYYTYILALNMYNRFTAQCVVIIYITALHIILSNFDVRAEGYLSTFIIAATYHIFRAAEKKYSMHIFYGAVYCACAMMTKGIFTLVTIASGFIFYWLITKQWKQFIQPKWYLLFVLSFLLILPELYCLYVQFDLHPEKIVYGKTHVSGIKFFFWDSQFGRFFNNGPIKGSGSPFFFFHNILWAFLPWSLLLYISVVDFLRKRKSANAQRLIISLSALVTFVMFSLSKFQLSYYLVIIFPHFSILTANWLVENFTLKKCKRIHVMLVVLFIMLVILSAFVSILFNSNNLILFLLIILICCIAFFQYRNKSLATLAWKSIFFSFLLSAFLNISFYPTLMQYQSGMQAGKWLNIYQPKISQAIMYRCLQQTSFSFYSNAEIRYAENPSQLTNLKMPFVLYARKKQIDSLVNDGFKISVLKSFSYFHISKLTLKFISPKTRNNELQTFELAEINK